MSPTDVVANHASLTQVMGDSARDFVAAQWTFSFLSLAERSDNGPDDRAPNGNGMGAAR
jgi:hypothetical protein